MSAGRKAPRKWLRAHVVPNNEAGLIEIATFRGWFFHELLNKPIHSVVICNMSLSTIIALLRGGRIYRTTINPEWIEFERRKILALPDGARMAIVGDTDFAEVGILA